MATLNLTAVHRPPAGAAFGPGALGVVAFLTMLALSGASRASANPLPERQLPSDGAPIPQIPRDNWKDCSFNDRLIGCQDRELADGVRIDWRDGRSMTYRLIRAGFPLSLLRDRYGGLWQREILGQGNAVYTKVLLDEVAPGKAFSGKAVPAKPPQANLPWANPSWASLPKATESWCPFGSLASPPWWERWATASAPRNRGGGLGAAWMLIAAPMMR